MKLISCFIENFGNMKQRNFDFSRGLTSLCEHNGYGKTTLAAFLKAMFYGLKQTRKNDKEFGEREHYYPFEGGKFGGNVVFEKGGVIYKIERFFGRKSATDDFVTLYADGESVSPVPDDIGKEFFGLDEQSFLRTVFINSSDTEGGATGDISRMLNGFVDDADYEGAKKILERQQKEYKALRGRGGKIDEKHDEILRLNESIKNKEKINGELGRKYEERSALAKKVAELEQRQSTSRDKNLVLQKWRTYDGFAADADAERVRLEALKRKYPAGIPDSTEAGALKRAAEEINLANERLASAVFTDEKARRLKELDERFAQGLPADDEFTSANGDAAEIIRLEAEISNYERLAAGGAQSKFPAGVPDADEVKKYSDRLISLREKKNQQSTPASAGKKIPIIIAAFALALLCAGVGLMFVHTIAGGVTLIVGAVCVLVAIFVYFKSQINSMKPTKEEHGEEENEIKMFLAKCGYFSEGGIEVDFNNLLRDIEIYNTEVKERENYTVLLNEKRAAVNEVKTRVNSFLKKYNFTGENAQAELTRLGALTAEYGALKSEKEGVSDRLAANKEEIEEYRRTADKILLKYEIAVRGNLGDTAAEIERDGNEAERLKENIERLERRASAFREENGLNERPAEGEEDTRSIDTTLAATRDELSILDREISDDEASVESLAEIREELETAQEEELALRKKYELLLATSSLLERAEQSLKDRYVFPVKNSFLNYSGLLERALGEKVTFDKDFKVKFERNGEDRSDAHLSAGQKSLCALCLRLALIDNMYKGDKPFIIMDDPFVHLDNEHMRRAEVLLKELAQNRQIIYFCCHESRKIQDK